MLISARQAATALAAVGVPRRHVRRLIACGACGPVTRSAGAVLVERSRIADLVARPRLGPADVEAICPWGLFVARREVPVGNTVGVLAALREDWAFSSLTAVWLKVRIDEHGFVPLVATVAGFVVAGGNLRRVLYPPNTSRHELEVGEPTEWFESVRDTRIDTPPGRPWVVLGWDLRAQVAARSEA